MGFFKVDFSQIALGGFVLFALFLTIVFILFNKLNYNKKLDTMIRLVIGTMYIFYLVGRLDYIYSVSGDYNCRTIQLALPVGNISPCTFSFILISSFLPKKLQYPINCFLSYISLAFFVATIGICFEVINSDCGYVMLSELFDTLAHLLTFILGIYLAKTNQIDFNKKSFITATIYIYSIVFIISIINLIFKTNYFGLGFYGNHEIYGMHLTDNSILNFLIYIVGLFILMLTNYFIIKITKKK